MQIRIFNKIFLQKRFSLKRFLPKRQLKKQQSRKLFRVMALLAISSMFSVQSQSIEFENNKLTGDDKNAQIVTHMGREALKFTGGRLWLEGVELSNGVIEFEVAMPEVPAFIGVNFRVASDIFYEDFYLRTHLDNKPDALQYQPVVNRVSAWQIYSDENAISAADLHFDKWNKVKIVLVDDKAEIFVNSDIPQLHVPDMKNNIVSGKVALRLFGARKEPVYFSNIRVRRLNKDEGLISSPKADKPLPDGLITQWQVSSLVEETQVNRDNKLNINLEELSWESLSVEHNGIVNLAKRALRNKEANTVLVKLVIDADKAEVRKLAFGFSDRAQIFLNGNLLFAGNDGWRTRDYRYLGTVGWHDNVGLALQPGKNHLIVAVSETFGGWAWTGAWQE